MAGAWRHTFRVAAELGGKVLEAGPWQRTFRSAAAGIGGAVLGGGEAWRRCFGRRRSLAAHFSCGGRAWRRSFGAAAWLGGSVFGSFVGSQHMRTQLFLCACVVLCFEMSVLNLMF